MFQVLDATGSALMGFSYFYYERCILIYDPYQRDHGSRHSRGPCISDDAAYCDEYGDRGFLGRD